MVASIDSLEAPGEPPLPTGVPKSQIQGRSPWYLAWLRLRRNKLALACAVLFVLIVLFWFYALAIILLSGAVVNELRFEQRG